MSPNIQKQFTIIKKKCYNISLWQDLKKAISHDINTTYLYLSVYSG